MNWIGRITDLMAEGKTCCLVTIIRSDDPNLAAGSKVVVLQDGTMEGSLGSVVTDEEVRLAAMEALSAKSKRTRTLRGGVQAFFDLFSTDLELLICGAGHIAVPLARFARTLAFAVTVIDDRPDFAHPSRFPGCTVVADNFTTALRCLSLGASTYVVVITRGHEHDKECLMEILPKTTAYVGLIGSRRRVQFVLEMLREEGIPVDRLDGLFTPIGLPIGAESPEEIALSIAAELVCVRRKGAPQARALRAAPGGLE